MARSLDDLIDFLLGEIALSGQRGESCLFPSGMSHFFGLHG